MEHEVFIPVPAETLREALRDHARVARCVPGLQQDADASARPLSGRLKVRVGGHTITYRGALTLTERAGAFTAKGAGTEVRGAGSAKLTVRVRLTEAPGGTTVAFTATVTSQGRLSDIPTPTTESTARRLLDRFAAGLAEPGAAGATGEAGAAPRAADASGSAPDAPERAEMPADGPGRGPDGRPGSTSGGPDHDVRDVQDVTGSGAAGGGAPHDPDATEAAGSGADPEGSAAARAARRAGSGPEVAGSDAPGGDGGGAPQASGGAGSGPEASGPGAPGRDSGAPQEPDVADAVGSESDASDIPQDPDATDAASSGPDASDIPQVPDSGDAAGSGPAARPADASAGFGATASGDGDFLVPLDPPAEAAHARRTMIGRSAEEVDHAPPRGRYAPAQAPDAGGAGAALRWVAPAAALAIAGAVVVGRALRRRR